MQLEQLRMQMLSLSTYHVHYFKNKIISMKFKSIRGIDWIYSNLIWVWVEPVYSINSYYCNLYQLTYLDQGPTNSLKYLKDFQTRVVKMMWSSRRIKVSRRHWGPNGFEVFALAEIGSPKSNANNPEYFEWTSSIFFLFPISLFS